MPSTGPASKITKPGSQVERGEHDGKYTTEFVLDAFAHLRVPWPLARRRSLSQQGTLGKPTNPG